MSAFRRQKNNEEPSGTAVNQEAMMKMRVLILMTAAILFTSALISTAFAVEKMHPGPTPTRINKNAALTEGECRGLGGTVVTANGCGATQTACETADKDGVLRRLCIDNKKN